RGALFANLLEVPGAWLEAYGLVGVALVGWLFRRVRTEAAQPAALWWLIGLQLAAVCTFVVRRRFLLSCAVPVAALAAVPVARLPARWRVGIVALAAVLGLAGAFRGGIDADRRAERELGAYLGARLLAGEEVTGDLPRVVWFAGRRPPPPRHFDVEQLVAMAGGEDVRYFVFSARSQRGYAVRLERELGAMFGRLSLPESLQATCDERGLVVLARR
ncbi:MAG: hypothetical protein KDE27_29670, partial [Planctomycetes bacterium]|nr:hypothetical protein [Planctomycetota bacterium]